MTMRQVKIEIVRYLYRTLEHQINDTLLDTVIDQVTKALDDVADFERRMGS